MKRQFLNMVEQFCNANIADMPNYKVMKAIATHPEAYFPNPEETAAAIKISVSQSFIDDEEMFTITVESYVKALSHIYSQLTTDFSTAVADRMWPHFARQLSLTYND